MAKKMRVRSGGKHKVMAALADASGLGKLGRGHKSHGHKGFRYEVELKPKDLLSTDKLVALAVAKAAIDQLKTGAGEGLSSDERREIERAVSSLVSGKKYSASSSANLGFNLSFEPDAARPGAAKLKIGSAGANKPMAIIGERDAFDALVVCPNKFKGKLNGADSQLSLKAQAAGRFAAQAMYNLLDTGLTTQGRKVYRVGSDGSVKEAMKLFLGPADSSKSAKMELPSNVCYRVQLSRELREKAAANYFLTQTASASSAVSTSVAKVIEDFRKSTGSAFASKTKAAARNIEESETLNGLGQMAIEESETIMLDGMRRRRKGRKGRKSVARKSPARRRESSSKRKASRRRKK